MCGIVGVIAGMVAIRTAGAGAAAIEPGIEGLELERA
jgi:hypothetical protein